MKDVLLQRAIKLNRNHKQRKWWQRIVRTMAMIVVFCTTYALILPAITMEQETLCGKKAHTHGEDCHTTQTISALNCGLTEGIPVLHSHSELCWDDQGTLLCPLPELAEHIHGETCWDGEGTLLCQEPQMEHHTHTESCLVQTEQTVLTCQMEEHTHVEACFPKEEEDTQSDGYLCGLGEHTHVEACRDAAGELVCTIPEHVHDLSCVVADLDTTADVETEDQWAKSVASVAMTGDWDRDLLAVAMTQLGYQESVKNVAQIEGDIKGYTRYGAWYGAPYGDWNSMFASFCLHYAQIPEEAVPHQSNAARWYEDLQERGLIREAAQALPGPGDLIFLSAGDGQSLRSGIVLEVTQTQILTIEGDRNGAVGEGQYDQADPAVLGHCALAEVQKQYEAAREPVQPTETTVPPETAVPEETTADTGPAVPEETTTVTESTIPGETVAENLPVSQTVETENYIVTVTYPADLVLPEGTELRVVEYARDSEIFRRRCEEAGYELEWLLNIGFFQGDVELDLNGFFQVMVTSKLGADLGQDITHFAEDGAERITGQDASETAPEGRTAVAFSADSFSDFGGGTFAAARASRYPQAVMTGNVTVNRLRFYNICEDGENGIDPLAGCVFEIKQIDDYGNEIVDGYSATLTSTDHPELDLPPNIPNGHYKITETSVPEGHMRDTDYIRTFRIEGGMLSSEENIGTFINHHKERLRVSKTGEVEDYNSRIYQILLSAESHMRAYKMDPVDVLFVVDQSNSMLFPSGLNDTGKRVTLRLDGWNNVANMNNLNLDRNQVYYIISDPQGTSTVWALYHNGSTWLYQDASYYAKAWHENGEGYKDPNETAIFPENRSYNDQKNAEKNTGTRSNGGGLGHNLTGSGLGNYINNQANKQNTFIVYTASTAYNRLHYLEEALVNMVYQLADVSADNRVTITEFTKEVKEQEKDCMGPLELTSSNVDKLVAEIHSINTSGGTRQDIALEHVYSQHLNDASEHFDKGVQRTYTILVTDGAPVLSGSNDLSLGAPTDAASSNGSVYARIKHYAQQVRTKSSLMTVSLGMKDVAGGSAVLEDIASNDDFYCPLDDAAVLVQSMQDLLFDAFKAKETINVTGDVTDEISDSFYPIAWLPKNSGIPANHTLLMQDDTRDWILLQSGDWITLDGQYAYAGAFNAAGQLQQKEDGTFYIQWKNVQVSDPNADTIDPDRIAWVPESSTPNRRVIDTYDGRKWVVLDDGDYIDRNGQYMTTSPDLWAASSYGRVAQNNGDYTITWGIWANGNNRLLYNYSWRGTFYVKAKEDFIGGNAIDTNKSAAIEATAHYQDNPVETVPLPTPTVNVHLLDMTRQESEVTVYLGDIINETGLSPLDSVKYFYNNTNIEKILTSETDTQNKVAVSEEYTDLTADTFTLRHALGRDLTEEEWAKLANGEAVTIPYTYDDPSSHGPVGAFTFRLTKSGIHGASPDWRTHEATAACQLMGAPSSRTCQNPAETYVLSITYTAYELGQSGRPGANVHNGTGSPGTQVSSKAASKVLNEGYGIVEKNNIHKVHVISGRIEITKRFAQGITSDGDQTFTFTLHREEDLDNSRDVTNTITVPAGASEGSATIRFDHLRRGTYTVTEQEDLNSDFMLKEILVLDTTNCHSTPAIGGSAEQVTFLMGNTVATDAAPAGENVIGHAPIPDTEAVETYTSYTGTPNGVYGAAVFVNQDIAGEIPVAKLWDDGNDTHVQDEVFVVLYLQEGDGAPAPVTVDGQHRILRLDAANNWQGSFKVPLKDRFDKVTNYNYSVREVSRAGTIAQTGWLPAVLENDRTTVVYYEKALEDGSFLSTNTRGYVVHYTAGENGAWTVENHRGIDLPKTGGIGTHYHTFGGLLLMAGACVYYVTVFGRKRQKGGAKRAR